VIETDLRETKVYTKLLYVREVVSYDEYLRMCEFEIVCTNKIHYESNRGSSGAEHFQRRSECRSDRFSWEAPSLALHPISIQNQADAF
jgi:hypothetical protein